MTMGSFTAGALLHQPGPGGFGDLLGLGGFGVLSGAGDSVGLAVASGVGSGVGLGVRWGVGAGVGTWVGAGVGAGVALSVGSAEVSTAPPAGVDGGCVRSVSFGDTLGGCDVAGAVGDDAARRDRSGTPAGCTSTAVTGSGCEPWLGGSGSKNTTRAMVTAKPTVRPTSV
jgi:hypothetical protein